MTLLFTSYAQKTDLLLNINNYKQLLAIFTPYQAELFKQLAELKTEQAER